MIKASGINVLALITICTKRYCERSSCRLGPSLDQVQPCLPSGGGTSRIQYRIVISLASRLNTNGSGLSKICSPRISSGIIWIPHSFLKRSNSNSSAPLQTQYSPSCLGSSSYEVCLPGHAFIELQRINAKETLIGGGVLDRSLGPGGVHAGRGGSGIIVPARKVAGEEFRGLAFGLPLLEQLVESCLRPWPREERGGPLPPPPGPVRAGVVVPVPEPVPVPAAVPEPSPATVPPRR